MKTNIQINSKEQQYKLVDIWNDLKSAKDLLVKTNTLGWVLLLNYKDKNLITNFHTETGINLKKLDRKEFSFNNLEFFIGDQEILQVDVIERIDVRAFGETKFKK